MASPLLTALQHGPLLLDGGLATALEAMGHDLRDPLWSAKLLLEDPEAIEAAHRSFVHAGAQVLTTASYQASLPGLRARGLDDAAALALLEHATELARRAAHEHDVWVAASAGPYGAYLADGSEYRGDYGVPLTTLVDFHRARLPAFASADVVAFETVPCRIEAEAIALACDALPPEQPVWVSFSARDDAYARSGEAIELCVASVLANPRVVAVGINCSAPQHVLGLLQRIGAITDLPLVAYPNAGRRYDDGAWHGEAIDPPGLVRLTRSWIEAGARLVGGCCQIGYSHLQALREALQHPDARSPTMPPNDG